MMTEILQNFKTSSIEVQTFRYIDGGQKDALLRRASIKIIIITIHSDDYTSTLFSKHIL